MSWIKENYEKAALGGAAVVALGLGALMWSNHNAAKEAFVYELPEQKKDASVEGLPGIEEIEKSFKSPHEIIQPIVNDRQVDLFTSVPIVVKKGDIDKAVDLFNDDPVHEGIKNTFWIKNGIDPGFENSPDLDPDEDGFSNREEYLAGSKPLGFKSHPDPVLKLAIVNVETNQMHIKPTFFNGNSTFRLETKKGQRLDKMPLKPIAPGAIIPFTSDEMKARFKFVSIDGDERNRVWTIEDQKPNKAGVKYEFNKRGEIVGAEKRDFGIMDSTVEFKLKALKEEGKTFKVEENMTFTLPIKGGDEKKEYLFKSIDLTQKTAVIEYKNKAGEIATHTVKF